MSQVIVENDQFKEKRLKSADQEMRIDREGAFKKWHRGDVTGLDPIALLAGVAVAPLVIFFWIFSKFAQFAIFVSAVVGKILSAVVGTMKAP